MSLLTISILNFNNYQDTNNCLESIFALEREADFNIIVFDNQADIEKAKQLKKAFPEIRVIISKKNLGFGRAHNIVAKKFAPPDSRYILFLNNDTIVLKNCLKNAISVLETNKKIALLGALNLDAERKIATSCYNNPNFIDELLRLLRIYSLASLIGVSHHYAPNWDYQKEGFVENVVGSFLLVRKDIFLKVGGFDESFFAYYEELDLARRIHLAGYKVYYSPDVKIIHLGATQNRSEVNAKTIAKIKKQSRFTYCKKYYGTLYTTILKILSFPGLA